MVKICARALEQFADVFNGIRENDLLKLRRWRKDAEKYLSAATDVSFFYDERNGFGDANR